MLKKIKTKIKKNLEVLALSFLILVTIIFTSYYNYNKKKILNNYSNLLHNVYFKKSTNDITIREIKKVVKALGKNWIFLFPYRKDFILIPSMFFKASYNKGK